MACLRKGFFLDWFCLTHGINACRYLGLPCSTEANPSFPPVDTFDAKNCTLWEEVVFHNHTTRIIAKRLHQPWQKIVGQESCRSFLRNHYFHNGIVDHVVRVNLITVRCSAWDLLEVKLELELLLPPPLESEEESNLLIIILVRQRRLDHLQHSKTAFQWRNNTPE